MRLSITGAHLVTSIDLVVIFTAPVLGHVCLHVDSIPVLKLLKMAVRVRVCRALRLERRWLDFWRLSKLIDRELIRLRLVRELAFFLRTHLLLVLLDHLLSARLELLRCAVELLERWLLLELRTGDASGAYADLGSGVLARQTLLFFPPLPVLLLSVDLLLVLLVVVTLNETADRLRVFLPLSSRVNGTCWLIVLSCSALVGIAVSRCLLRRPLGCE